MPRLKKLQVNMYFYEEQGKKCINLSSQRHGNYISLCHRENGGRPSELHHQLIGLYGQIMNMDVEWGKKNNNTDLYF